MKDSSAHYNIGPLLYCPANRESIANSIIGQKLGSNFSLALCLEDTINDNCVEQAEQILAASLRKIYQASCQSPFYLPKIFIRVRYPAQIQRLTGMLKDCLTIVNGFIIPKFSMENADAYIQNIIKANELSKKQLFMMPIYESASLVNLQSRYRILYGLKEKLAKAEPLVLNIRVGGNDLCHLFAFRRHANESIHKILPVAHIFSDIITVYGMDYVISGPVWEYYSGEGWEDGLRRELADDKLCGFTGKTVIHPNQIEIVNRAYQILRKDYEDALRILEWDTGAASYVSANSRRERMDELKTHSNWAKRILLQAQAYGIKG